LFGKRFLCLALAIFSITAGKAQFDPDQCNVKLLEHEIKTLIDSTRMANHLLPLYNDSILYVASAHHAGYLVKKGALSHEEKENKQLFSPQDRAMYFGAPGNYYVGENIVYTPYNASVRVKNKTFQTTNYTEIARCLVYSWVNSKGHFKNIIDPDYQVTGLAIGIDPKTKRIYACQKFAQVLYTYSFPENHAFFPYSTANDSVIAYVPKAVDEKHKYPFKLRDDKDQECEECKEVWELYPELSVRISNNNFILRIESDDFVKKLIQHKNDGFAIEIVPFDAFACGNPAYEQEPSRRNGAKKTSGMVLEPVYRKDLMKGFKKRKKVKNLSFVKHIFTADSISFFKRFGHYKLAKFDASYFEIKLGKVPKDLNGWWNHNLMYIHKNQICHFVYLTNYGGEVVTEILNVDYIPPVPINDYDIELEHFADTLELFYNSGQSVTNSTELKKVLALFEKNHLTIEDIAISGFCSVEGDSLTNELLHQQRAATILNDFKQYTDSTSRFSVQSEVAWEHFYQSVKNHPKWGFLYGKSKSEISAWLSDPKKEKPIEILAQERKVKVVIRAVRELIPVNAMYYFTKELKKLVYEDSQDQLHYTDASKVQRLYQKGFYLTTVGRMDSADFLKVTPPNYDGMFSHNFLMDIAFYRYHYLRNSADKKERFAAEAAVESVFNECGAAEHLCAEFHYLTACLLTDKIAKQGKKIDPESEGIKKAFERLNLMFTSYELDSALYLNVAKANLNIINILIENIGEDQLYKYNDIVNSSLIQIVEYYRKTDQLNPETVLKLGKLLCYYHNIALAVDLCRPFLYDNEVLKLYLPIAYVHSSYLSPEFEKDFEQEFHQLLLEAKTKLSQDEWCQLFYGKYGIPFQVMDRKALHTEFCATCPDRVTEVFEEFKKD
jgi:uncharacterized protein YkwD